MVKKEEEEGIAEEEKNRLRDSEFDKQMETEITFQSLDTVKKYLGKIFLPSMNKYTGNTISEFAPSIPPTGRSPLTDK